MVERDCYLSTMESNHAPILDSSSEARDSLDVVDRVNVDLADRLITPWW